ncbi:MAG TPA: hypothetical protein VE991_05865 [Acidimicrobiales bacterium]|nr:hypothetical protein [Acidimicrobiales bacterium]
MARRIFTPTRGAHSRGGSQQRLQALSSRIPLAGSGGLAPSRRGWGGPTFLGLRHLVALVVVVIVVFVAVQWFRGVPSPTFAPAALTSLRLPGQAPAIPWPAGGTAAVSLPGVGLVGTSGDDQAVPIASVAKVLTAYVVLQDHPLSLGQTGPTITVPDSVVAAYQAGAAGQQSEVKVSSGETITELQALEGLLIASGNDMAILLAQWDMGSTDAFVARANTAAKNLGLTATHMTDPSGLDQATVSSAVDLVRLGQAAMANAVFKSIVGMPQATLPEAGLLYNYDYDLGHNGIIGIKTGTDGAAGGCFLFEAQQAVSGQTVSVIGVLLGQQGVSPITTVLANAKTLVQAAFAAVRPVPLVSPTQTVGTVTTAWGSHVTVTAPDAPQVLAWPGLELQGHIKAHRLSGPVAAGAVVGTLEVDTGSKVVDIPLKTTAAVPGPGPGWRLTRL